VPADYRRLLGLIRKDTPFEVVRGVLRQYPDALLREWLAELEEIGYLERVLSAEERDLDFTKLFAAPSTKGAPLLPEDAKKIARTADAAGKTLASTGVFLAEERRKARPPCRKTAAEIVVLICEDDPDQLALADLRVTMAGFQVRVARSAGELVEVLRKGPTPEVLLQDVDLPDGNGFKILAKIRGHPVIAALPVIMLTARTSPKDIRLGLELGADGYITKPYSKNILADMIIKVLKLAPAK
jgi:CheY-like chemotaxis protein